MTEMYVVVCLYVCVGRPDVPANIDLKGRWAMLRINVPTFLDCYYFCYCSCYYYFWGLLTSIANTLRHVPCTVLLLLRSLLVYVTENVSLHLFFFFISIRFFTLFYILYIFFRTFQTIFLLNWKASDTERFLCFLYAICYTGLHILVCDF